MPDENTPQGSDTVFVTTVLGPSGPPGAICGLLSTCPGATTSQDILVSGKHWEVSSLPPEELGIRKEEWYDLQA